MRIRFAVVLIAALSVAAPARSDDPVQTGVAAFGDWTADAPGVRRRITADALSSLAAGRSASRSARVVRPPAGAAPKVPDGFEATMIASGLSGPRTLRTAPNGDIFIAEMTANRIRVVRGVDGSAAIEQSETFAGRLSLPFGIAFHPPGPNPQWVYVANTNSVVRFRYQVGDMKARGQAETVVATLPSGGHATRDVAFSRDGTRMFVSVGSESNVGEGIGRKSAAESAAWDRDQNAVGAGWGSETLRAAVLSFTPEGKDRRIFATGIRNCVGLAVNPTTGDVWCATNERDGLGDNLVPDYVTRVREGAFYGWPWYYIGDHEDPRLKAQRPDLKGRVTVPDVLIQAHSAPLQLTFYDGKAFPAQMHGDAFVALHGSWNRASRTGYKIVRLRMENGVPTGEYEDFMTGFVIGADEVWARPVGVAVSRDGALIVSDDGNGTLWRVKPRKVATESAPSAPPASTR